MYQKIGILAVLDIEDDGWKKIEDNPLLWNSRALDFR